MGIKLKLKISLAVTVLMLGMVGVAFADSFLPLRVGQSYLSTRSDPSNNEWTVLRYFDGQMTADSFDYFHGKSCNYNNDGNCADLGYFRLTENALYGYNPNGEDSLQFQAAPIGTKWILEEQGHGYNYKVIEIVDISQLTVPFGTFDETYKHRRYRCVDPNDLGQGKSPDWYEWFVPGMFVVKEEDYWVDGPAPEVMELEQIHPAEPLHHPQLLLPLETGQIFTYERTDNDANSWETTWEIHEKTMIHGDEYFRVSECNYYPNGGCDDMYLISSVELAYVWQNYEKQLIFLDGPVGINWSHNLGEGFVETRAIDRIEEITVPFGGPFLALVYHNEEKEAEAIYNLCEEYFVPGLGIVQFIDSIDPDLPSQYQLPIITKLISILPGESCGSLQNPFPDGDMNKDCEVNFLDFAVIANTWLECTKPECD